MPQVRKVTRVANPRRRRATTKKKANTTRRRKMSDKQIRYFGTKAQKAGLKRRRTAKRAAPKRKRNVARRTRRNVAAGFYDEEGFFHPIRASHDYSKRRAGEVKKKRSASTRSRSKRNPSLVLTLGAVNPKRKKRSATMARKRTRRAAPAKRRRRRNPVAAPRRRRRTVRRRRNYSAAPVRRRRVTRRRRRRNPTLFGSAVSGGNMAQAVLGGLVGVAAAKFIPTAIPINLGGGNVIKTVMTGVSAFIASMMAGKFVSKTFGDSVLFGGLMQTGSVALNAFLPAVGKQLALSGLGDIVPTQGFAVPQNSVLRPAIAAPTGARVTQSGLDRTYGRAY